MIKKPITHRAPAGSTICEGKFIKQGQVITRSPPSGPWQNCIICAWLLCLLKLQVNLQEPFNPADHTRLWNQRGHNGPHLPTQDTPPLRSVRGWRTCLPCPRAAHTAQSHDVDVDRENNTILHSSSFIHTINASLITAFPVTQIAVKVQDETSAF